MSPLEPDEETTPWAVYLVRRADGALYTGIATDVERRFQEHQEGRGAKALRGRGPLRLAAAARVGDRSAGQRVEARIKRLPKHRKEQLAGDPRRLEAFVRSVVEGDEEGR